MAQTSVELTAIQQLIEDIRKGNDIALLNDGHIEHYLAIERKQRELISAQRYIDGYNKAKERMYSEEVLLSAFEAGMMFIGEDKGSFKEWFEQFKKQ